MGYRIKSHVATRFRQWATRQLREYNVKDFVLDDERLKNPDQPLNYLKIRFPSVQATQVSFEDDMDLITKEGIMICSAHLFLAEFAWSLPP